MRTTKKSHNISSYVAKLDPDFNQKKANVQLHIKSLKTYVKINKKRKLNK
jgi:hypothetical protein